MPGLLQVVKTILIPALISLSVYLLLSLLILPFIRRHRQRYAHYLPLQTITAHTSTLRERISDALMRSLLPSSWRLRHSVGGGHDDDDDDGGSVFDQEEGEDMVGFEMDVDRREALERRRGDVVDSERRLSRDLEEGFMDDSDEEDGEDGEGQRRGGCGSGDDRRVRPG
ncbi:hypothetical protein ACO22_05790 [Paracoccidioides brasiliensis]|uniref:Uncharacterized protein n=1 Tax=Paracoccidioides brasiliensis TaxID=121759 RepID=A0A1D2J9G3_PARBR|nr:hypothetical protein ACO22_05790 [Paracoccidioides brasiliensis]ODH48171.1 hypothetical protein GX48_05767 [Paracoccidioides brasiliensis]